MYVVWGAIFKNCSNVVLLLYHFLGLVPVGTKLKRFHEQKLIVDVKKADFSFDTDDPNANYSALINTFSLIVEKHTPLKKKIVRENHAPFITEDLRKVIHTRSRLKKEYIKNPSEVNKKLYKRQIIVINV